MLLPNESEELVDAPEESAVQRFLPSPQLPSQSISDDHCITHIPYRSWCRECVEERGREMAHGCVDRRGRNTFYGCRTEFALLGLGLICGEASGDGPKAWEDPVWKDIVMLAGPTVGGTCDSVAVGTCAVGTRWKGDDPNSESIVM